MPRGFGRGGRWWHGRLRDAGYRLTLSRDAILSVLSGASGHLSAEEIYLKVHNIYPAGGLSSIYRTLELLTQMGLVFKFDFGDGRARYELAQGPEGERHHHHLVCTNCGRVIDCGNFDQDEEDLLAKIEKGILKKFSFKVTSHMIRFLGLCDKCRNGISHGQGRGT